MTINHRIGQLTGRIKAYWGQPLPPEAMFESRHLAYAKGLREGYTEPVTDREGYEQANRERQELCAAIALARGDEGD